jgi:hypothetical protein
MKKSEVLKIIKNCKAEIISCEEATKKICLLNVDQSFYCFDSLDTCVKCKTQCSSCNQFDKQQLNRKPIKKQMFDQ